MEISPHVVFVHISSGTSLRNVEEHESLKSQLLSLSGSEIINPKRHFKKSALRDVLNHSVVVSKCCPCYISSCTREDKQQQLNLRDCYKFPGTHDPIIRNGNQLDVDDEMGTKGLSLLVMGNCLVCNQPLTLH